MTLRAVLFDLDETLTDRTRSIERVAAVMRETFSAKRITCPAEIIVETMMRADERGYRTREAFCADVSQATWWTTPPAAEEVLQFWRDHFPDCAVEREGALDTLRVIQSRGLRLGVITNGSAHSQRRKIDVLGIRPFLSTLQISEEVGMKKPDPLIFHRALAELDLEPGEAMFVGDHPINDVAAARSVGIQAVWLEGIHAWPEDVERPTSIIQRLAEILQWV